MPENRIQRRGLADNYWHMGVPGPGGPCSEIYYDRGAEYGREGGPEADEDRYLEVWNLVFMQYQLSAVRSKVDFDTQGELPSRNIDTGMGLERMAALLQGVDNIYEVDTMWKVLERAAELTDQKYGRDHASDVALRVVADHTRAAVMLVADGVIPSNEGRGYVLRRIVRRSVRDLRLLAGAQRGGDGGRGGSGERFLHDLSSVAIGALGDQYPELIRDAPNIHTVLDAEESAFLGTLRTGTAIFEAAVEEVTRRNERTLGGAQAFQLHDTYGFPIDLTLEMAAEQGLSVDDEGFRTLMAQQRQRAKDDAAAKKTGNADISVFAQFLERSGKVVFTGYDEVASDGTVIGLLSGGASVPAAGAGSEVDVVLDRTPCYAEGGGQLADTGIMRSAGSGAGDGAVVEVLDVQAPVPGLVVHRCRVNAGELAVGDMVHTEIDIERRRAISRSHTATHLVHRAFRGALGESAAQAGWRTRPAGSGSTSPRSARSPPQCSPMPRTRSTRFSSTTWTFARSIPPSARRGRWARSRCSARNTASRCASSRWASTPGSCAAARTWPGQASSGWSRSSASPRSAPVYGESRRWSGSTRSGSWPGRACLSASSASSSRRHGRTCLTGSRASLASCARRSVMWPGRSRPSSPTSRTTWSRGPRT